MLKRIGWVLAGLVGSFAIVVVWFLTLSAQVPVKIRSGGSAHTSQWDQGYVTAYGTWVIENGKQAFPLQFTDLTCVQSEKMCRSATAEIAFNDTLSVDTETYDVVRWTGDTVILTSTWATCFDYTYTISRVNERVVGTRTPKKNPTSPCPFAKETLQLSLVDGFMIVMALQQEASARTQPFMWASLAILWAFIATRLFRRRRSDAEPNMVSITSTST